MAADRDTAPPLLRVMGRFDLTAAVINAVIGSSIFGMPALLARLTGTWSPLACLFAGLGILVIVLCFAEVGSRFERPGGSYVYAREAFGPFVGFEVGWLTFWIRVTALAAGLNVFVDYLAQLVPQAAAGLGRAATMVALVAVIGTINVWGVRQAAWMVDAFTLAKLLPLLALIVLGLPRLDSAALASQQVVNADWAQAILLLVFAYGGFEAPLIPASEAKEPRRDTAFALLGALAVIAGVYMLVQLVVVGIVPQVAQAKAPVAAAFSALLGPAGVALASVAAMVSVYGYATGTVLQSPRLLYAMAAEGELPRVFAQVHPGRRTPQVAIATYALAALGLALWGSFAWNATLSAIARLVTYGLTCAALLVLRRSGGPPAFRLPGAVFLAPVGVGFCLWLLTTRSFSSVWILGVLLLVGAVLWWFKPRNH
jgi:amino acid transporter